MTTTTHHFVRCGNCRQVHSTPEQVKACYGFSGGLPDAPLPQPDLVRAYSKAYDEQQPAPTEKQLAFIERLYSERPSLDRIVPSTKRSASELIDTLLAAPKEIDQQAGGESSVQALLRKVPDGFYAMESRTGSNDLDFVAVVTSKGTVNPSAKGRRYVNRYLGGQGQVRIKASEQREFASRLNSFNAEQLNEARSTFGQQLGRCGCCGRSLTDATSRARGIGPDCWGKL